MIHIAISKCQVRLLVCLLAFLPLIVGQLNTVLCIYEWMHVTVLIFFYIARAGRIQHLQVGAGDSAPSAQRAFAALLLCKTELAFSPVGCGSPHRASAQVSSVWCKHRLGFPHAAMTGLDKPQHSLASRLRPPPRKTTGGGVWQPTPSLPGSLAEAEDSVTEMARSHGENGTVLRVWDMKPEKLREWTPEEQLQETENEDQEEEDENDDELVDVIKKLKSLGIKNPRSGKPGIILKLEGRQEVDVVAGIKQDADALLVAADAADVQLTLILCNDPHIQYLNQEGRGVNSPTDVLSFPLQDELMIGDLVISIDTAARQAAERGYTVREEVRVLLVHGLLHLFGYDHEAGLEAEKEMAEKEQLLMERLGWQGKGLIERAED